MAEDYRNQAIGVFELESECICFVALDAAAKAAAVKIQGVERNRLAAGACVKMRGSVSDVKAAMEAALDVARPLIIHIKATRKELRRLLNCIKKLLTSARLKNTMVFMH